MNPERLTTPRSLDTARSNQNIAVTRHNIPDAEESSRGSSRGLVQYENLVWEADLTNGSGKVDLSDSDKFLRISREQTAPSFDSIVGDEHDTKTEPAENKAQAKMPRIQNTRQRTGNLAAASFKPKHHERTIRFGEEALGGMCLSPPKIRGRAPVHLDSEDTLSGSDSDGPDGPDATFKAGHGQQPADLPSARRPRRADWRPARADRYRRQEVLRGAGFSAMLLGLDPVRADAAARLPTAAEALGNPRFNRRLQRAVQTVGAVGLPPPRLDELYFAAEGLKRQWVMQYRLEPRPPADRAGPVAKRPRFGRAREALRAGPDEGVHASTEHASSRDGEGASESQVGGHADGDAEDAPASLSAEPPRDLAARRLSPMPPPGWAPRGAPRAASPGGSAASPREPRDVLIEVSDEAPGRAWRPEASARPPNHLVGSGPEPRPDGDLPVQPPVPPLALARLRQIARKQARRRGGEAAARPPTERPAQGAVRTAASPWESGLGGIGSRGGGALTYRSHIQIASESSPAVLAALGFGPTGDRVGVEHGGGGSGGGVGLRAATARPATTRSLPPESDRTSGLRALARRQAAALGNRVLAKAAAGVRMLDLLQAVRSLEEAREIYARAEVLAQKQPQLDEVEARIREARQGLQDLRESLRTPPPPPPPRPPRIKFSRDPDRARPEGLSESWLPVPKAKVLEEGTRHASRGRTSTVHDRRMDSRGRSSTGQLDGSLETVQGNGGSSQGRHVEDSEARAGLDLETGGDSKSVVESTGELSGKLQPTDMECAVSLHIASNRNQSDTAGICAESEEAVISGTSPHDEPEGRDPGGPMIATDLRRTQDLSSEGSLSLEARTVIAAATIGQKGYQIGPNNELVANICEGDAIENLLVFRNNSDVSVKNGNLDTALEIISGM